MFKLSHIVAEIDEKKSLQSVYIWMFELAIGACVLALKQLQWISIFGTCELE